MLQVKTCQRVVPIKFNVRGNATISTGEKGHTCTLKIFSGLIQPISHALPMNEGSPAESLALHNTRPFLATITIDPENSASFSRRRNARSVRVT